MRIVPTAVDLFSGCGGLTAGLKAAGYEVLAAIEIDSKAWTTYALNHPEVRLYKDDIRQVPAARLLDNLGIARGDLQLLAGCPPCQGFSRLTTRNGKRRPRDWRNDLIVEFLRFVRVLRPQSVMLENVPRLAADRRFKRFRSEIRRLGYRDSHRVLDVSLFGVPQRRQRLIYVASRGLDLVELKDRSRKRVRTVRDTIGRMPVPGKSRDWLHDLPERRSPRVLKVIKAIPRNGGNRLALPPALSLKCHRRHDGFRDVYGRMKWQAPAPTITSGCSNPSKGRFLHPTQNRAITLREAALLQGFPARYRFVKSHGKEAIALMIGNALPPPFVTYHARHLLMQLRGAQRDAV
jgi:DNA (cytosine-5)-methyltransferase 1